MANTRKTNPTSASVSASHAEDAWSELDAEALDAVSGGCSPLDTSKPVGKGADHVIASASKPVSKGADHLSINGSKPVSKGYRTF